MKRSIALIALFALLYSCKKDTGTTPTPTTPPAEDKGTVKVTFNHVVDNDPFAYGTNYKNAFGDTFAVNKFQYYISNIKLTKSDNSVYSEPESYHLIHKDNLLSNNNFVISNIPAGTYKSITYVIGVDSIKNVTGAQENDLSPSYGMFWNWFTGYIMLKLEGTSPQSGSMDKTITFHIGGFGGANNVLRTVTINFAEDLVISKSKNPQLKLKTNVNELFKNGNTIEFSTDYFIMAAGLRANSFADNYKDMTTFEDIIP